MIASAASHIEKVRAHAARELAGAPNGEPFMARYRRFLKVEEHRLRLQHRAGESGLQIAQRRTAMVDLFLTHLYDEACHAGGSRGEPPRLALLALGGYGRSEICPHSDIDILFLHGRGGDDPAPGVTEIIQRLLYQLWDLGFRVGHSTRSLTGATDHANTDLIFKTSLLEARLLSGDRELFGRFEECFERVCIRGREREYLDWRIEDTATRVKKSGPTVFLQEPHVKFSPGALRDYHNILWSVHFTPYRDAVLRNGLPALVEAGLLGAGELRAMDAARDFLLRVRTELHLLDERAADTLTLHHQSQIAETFGYPQTNALRRNEAFMKDYYRHARDLHLSTSQLFESLRRDTLFPSSPSDTVADADRGEEIDGFISRGGFLHAGSPRVFDEDPLRLLRLFEHAQARDEDLSPELFQLVRRKIGLINRTYQYARAAREIFLHILSQRGRVARILRRMHEAGVLGRYLPEFGALFCLVQHEFFHRYTTDEHTLVCIEKLDALLSSDDARMAEYRKLFEDLEEPAILYLAILLHDTGKATGARHHAEASALFAQKVATRMVLAPERRSALIFLVDHHLTLSSTAQRRNVDDPATVIEFAQIVKTRARLDALMLLTLADGQGTGDENWSDWKESLVWKLHRSTARYLKEGEYFARLSDLQREQTQNELRGTLGPGFRDEIDAQFQYMPERYFQAFGPTAVGDHLGLMHKFFAQLEGSSEAERALSPAIGWKGRPESGHSEVWICTWDRADLLAKIAGSFAAAGLNILGADLYPRSDNIVFYLFRVCSAGFHAVEDPREQKPVEVTLAAALGDLEPFDFRPLWLRSRRRRAPLLPGLDFPTRVAIINPPTSDYTLVEVQTPDRLGLLYDLLDSFGSLGARVSSSRIATQNGAAIDSFYLTDARNGGRISDRELLRRIENSIRLITAAAPVPALA